MVNSVREMSALSLVAGKESHGSLWVPVTQNVRLKVLPRTYLPSFSCSSGRQCAAERQLGPGREHFRGAVPTHAHVYDAHPERGAHAAIPRTLSRRYAPRAPDSAWERDGARRPAVPGTYPWR